MHDEMTRVTLLFHDLGAFTFSLEPKKELKNKTANWSAEFPLEDEEEVVNHEENRKLHAPDTKSVDCQIHFKINDSIKKGRKPGFEIKGKGVDDKSNFKISSNHVLTEPSFF